MMQKILVVEDNPTNMKLATAVLEHAGYQVLTAEAASTGIAIARESLPVMILMDIHLPGMDGLEAARRLKADPMTQAIKVVALTAFAMKGDEERIRAAGCDGYIAKPIKYKEFLAQVQSMLDSVSPGQVEQA